LATNLRELILSPSMNSGSSGCRRPSCSAPPASFALGRRGWAKRRSLDGAAAGSVLGCRAALTVLECLAVCDLAAGSRCVAAFVVSEAGPDGFLPALGSSSSRSVALRVRQAGVPVRVAVRVLEHDEALAQLADHAVLDRDDRRLPAAEDADGASRGVRLDDARGVLAGLEALRELGLRHRAGVGRLGLHREAALREPRERADEVGGQAADDAGAHQDRLDVPVGVVVGEDGAVEVLVGPRGAEVPRGGEDRVDRVERVLLPVAVGVDAVHVPRRGHELHPAQRAGGGDVQVAAVVRLDLVDRGQDLPPDAVLDAGGLVDGEEEGRDAELLDEEVRDADRSGARHRERVARVRGRGRAVGVVGGGGGVAGEGGVVVLVAGLVRVLLVDLHAVSTRGRG
jgi:hypothetical protein